MQRASLAEYANRVTADIPLRLASLDTSPMLRTGEEEVRTAAGALILAPMGDGGPPRLRDHIYVVIRGKLGLPRGTYGWPAVTGQARKSHCVAHLERVCETLRLRWLRSRPWQRVFDVDRAGAFQFRPAHEGAAQRR